MAAVKTIDRTCPVCGKEATKCCSRCKSVYYCSVDHQKQHWKTHKRTSCDSTFQADQYTLHKREFDRIISYYKLNSEEKSEEIAQFLTSKDSEDKVSAPAFAEKFGTTVEEAVVFLEWIKVGVQFKESSIDTAKKAGLGNS
eukprot:scaffold1736_cov127-Cylindrotheca_fusiformis.AAC.90